jgi:hypothetical protein
MHAAGFTPPAFATTLMSRSTSCGQDAIDQAHEVRRVSRVGIARPQLLHDRHRHLGQIVEREVVERALIHEAHRCEDRIAPETLAVRDEDLVLRRHGEAL